MLPSEPKTGLLRASTTSHELTACFERHFLGPFAPAFLDTGTTAILLRLAPGLLRSRHARGAQDQRHVVAVALVVVRPAVLGHRQ